MIDLGSSTRKRPVESDDPYALPRSKNRRLHVEALNKTHLEASTESIHESKLG